MVLSVLFGPLAIFMYAVAVPKVTEFVDQVYAVIWRDMWNYRTFFIAESMPFK